jgi:hypothetical protein
MSPEIGGACLLAASEVPNFLAGALPSFMTIKKFAADEESVSSLRYAEFYAGVPIIAAGIGTSMVFESWWPLLIVIVTALYYYVGYEKHIRNPSPNATPINAQNGSGTRGLRWA